jgi:hypothetical protein
MLASLNHRILEHGMEAGDIVRIINKVEKIIHPVEKAPGYYTSSHPSEYSYNVWFKHRKYNIPAAFIDIYGE